MTNVTQFLNPLTKVQPNTKHRLPFITFEGNDGAGKTTVLNQLKPWLIDHFGHNIIFTREPGGDTIAEQIRHLILDPNNTAMERHTELLLYEAARAQLVHNVLQPALANQQLIICDRYTDSTYAYQGGGNGASFKDIDMLNQYATDGLTPGLTLYYDIDPQIGLARINQYRTDKHDRLDEKQLSYHQKVHTAYQHVVDNDDDRIVVIDGAQSIENRVNQSRAVIEKAYPELFQA